MPATDAEQGQSFEVQPGQLLLAQDVPKRSLGCSAKVGRVCCFLLCLLLAAWYIVLLPVASNIAVSVFLSLDDAFLRQYTGDGYDISNIVYKTWWPICGEWEEGETIDRFDNGCGGDCFSSALPRAMQVSLEENPGQLVTYTSRAADGVETIELSGWWMPADSNSTEDASTAPRIVIQHGFRDSSNRVRSLLSAYMLRRLGFSVLLNDFRDHGYSGASQNQISEWGDAYVYDLLGAWDFLVNDTAGVLGGPMSPSRVGLMGFSKGGFTTLNAFGLEGRVPAAWADSPPFTPKAVFVQGIATVVGSLGLGFVVPLLQDRLYANVLAHAESKGVDLERNLPEKNLPMGPNTTRPLFVTTNPLDPVVPVSDMQKVLSLTAEYPDKYKVDSLYTHKTCRGDAHCLGHLTEFDLYLSKLCNFWKPALGEDASSC